MRLTLSNKIAFKIGSICIVTYLASYFFRNILSVFTPKMLEDGVFTKTQIASISSVYMIVYALGQLVNGIIGDYIKPKIMTFIGLVISGIGLIVFPMFKRYSLMLVAFGLLGFGLSTLRGPLIKLITENTMRKQSRMCCTLLSVASFLGPFIASVFALIFEWNIAFFVAGFISFGFAIASFILLSVLEKVGIVRTKKRIKVQSKKSLVKDILSVFTIEKFILYLFISMITEIASSSINFWIPTYTTEHLSFSADASGIIFSVISCLKAVAPFICLFVLSKFNDKDIHVVRSMFLLSIIAFLAMIFIKNRYANILVFVLALMAVSVASAVLWNVYIPSLGKSGKTSSANGILDCFGYFAASVPNVLFAVIVEKFAWTGMIMSWLLVMVIGYIITIVDFAVVGKR